MSDFRILRFAIIVGTTLQVANSLLRHIGWTNDYYAQFGGMFISGVAGLLYAREVNRGYGAGSAGGAVGGMVLGGIRGTPAGAPPRAPPLPLPPLLRTSPLPAAAGGLLWQPWPPGE